MVGRGLMEPLGFGGVAVLARCTASGPAGEITRLERPIFREQSYYALSRHDAARRADLGAY